VKIAMIGTGGVGAYYGARLLEQGHEVHFLARSDYGVLKHQGLIVHSPHGEFRYSEINVWQDPQEIPPCDLICLAVKSTSNMELFPTLSPMLKNGAPILLLQNGLGQEELLNNLYPQTPVMAGLCFVCTFREQPGVIRHLDYGTIRMAPSASADSALVQKFAPVFTLPGIQVIQETDLQAARWKKLIWNIPFNGLSVVLQAHTDSLVQKAEPALRKLMNEVAAAANALGSDPGKNFVDKMIADTQKMRSYAPSMLIDFRNKRSLELDSIYQKPLQMAEDAGSPMPAVELLYHQLKFLNANNLEK